jgi:UDP-N-acetylglucosamine 2-epimerase (non-hydrolysing)
VGNVMIDTLVRLLPAAEERWPAVRAGLGLSESEANYVLVTLHRPSNVDDPEWLRTILDNLDELAQHTQIIFPMHPRTRQRLRDAAWAGRNPNLHLTAPLGYLDFMALQRNAAAVITDSGGIQEETTYLGVPCLTLRENTERPVTVQTGTNVLIGRDMGLLRAATERALRNGARPGRPPHLWDGHAGERIASVLASYV